MSQTEVALANEALSKFGGGEIASFDDATALARAVKRTYWRVVSSLMTVTDWSFLRNIVQLNPVNMTEMADTWLQAGWQYAYAMPPFGQGGILGMPYAYLSAPNRADGHIKDFEVQNGLIYCNVTTLYADVLQALDPAYWPPYFRNAAVDSLAYLLVMPVSGNSGLRDALKMEAIGTPEEGGRGGSLGLALLADGRNDSSDTLGTSSPLVDARWA